MITEKASSPGRWRAGNLVGELAGRTGAEPARGGAGAVMNVDGIDLHVREDGPVDGPVLLMLHGFGASTAWFDLAVAGLPECRIIRVDLLGHGGSSRPISGYDPDSQGRLYARLLTELDAHDVTVIGHSMGSIFGVATAEHCTRVTRLVLIGEGPDTTTATLPPGEWLIHAPWVGPLVHRHAPEILTSHMVRRAFAPGFDLTTAFAEPRQGLDDARSLSHPAFTQSMRHRKAWTGRRGLDVRLNALALPTLVVFGREDRYFNVDASLVRYRAVRTITTRVLNAVGHTPMIEAPGRVAGLIRQFISDPDSRSGPGIPAEVEDS